MPGNQKHHSDKWHSCVDKVMNEGHDESSASAICTKSLQDAGTEIYAAEAARHLHLLGATGTVRTVMHEGREHLVVPVVALMEGVIHAVNAATPEFVSADVLKRAASSWEGKPLCVGHPKGADGKQCSAGSKGILETHGFGMIRSAIMKGAKLCMEALVDPLRLKLLKQERLLMDLRAGKPVEVSVGAYVTTTSKRSEWKGKPYVGEWDEVGGDHLAFLPGGRGACSIDMGCGAHRAAMHLVTAEAIEALEPARPPVAIFSALEDVALDERMRLVMQAIQDEWNDAPEPMAYAQQIFDDKVIVRKGEETFAVPYVVTKDGEVSLGKPVAVKQTWVAAAGAMMDCPTCDGSGYVKDTKKDCPTCDGTGQVMRTAEMRALLGSRHSKKDMEIIQGVHDHAMALGATCDRANYKMLANPEGINQYSVGSSARIHDPKRPNIHGRKVTIHQITGHESSPDYHVKASDNKELYPSIFKRSQLRSAEESCGCGDVCSCDKQLRAATIRNEHGKWVLYTKDGSRKLGQHNTEAEAVAQEKAIETAKARRASEVAV